MAQATAFTAARSQQIEDQAVTSGSVDAAGNLTLVRHDGTTIAAGNVKGPQGDPGDNVDAKAYSDSGDATTLASAKSYADTKDATTLASAKSYTDGLVKTVAIVGAVDLNTYMTPGIFSVNLTADATAGTNYPSPASAGILEVDAAATGDYVYQRFIPYGPYGNSIFVRTRYNGTWYPWSSTTAGAYAVQMGTGTVNTGVVTALGFGATPLSPANGYARATNRITVPGTGTYSLSYRYRFVNGTTGTTRAFVELTLASLASHTYSIANDTGFIARAYCGQNEDAGEVGVSAVALQAGAQIGGNAYQSSGAARQIDGVLTIQRTG